MEILDPDLWNDDGTPKKPSKTYMDSLEAAQLQGDQDAQQGRDSYLSYARAKRELKENQPASIGDIVHFWDGEQCRAAIVMEVETFSHAATLRVHVPHEAFQDWHVDHEEGKGPNSWHWPEGDQ